ncbi:MAG: hypothetical protein ABIQ93_17050 [Saprospiraceae bacterium]
MTFNHLSVVQKVIIVVTLGLLAGIALSWPLWCAAARNSFPLLPLLGSAYLEMRWWSWLSAGLLVLLLFPPLFFPSRKVVLSALLCWLILLCSLDLNRLQPWVWLYALVFGTAVWSKNEPDTRNTWRWLIAAVYCWSGLHKLSPYFAEDNFAWFCAAFPFTKALATYPAWGYAVALLEIAIAFGLLWPRSRRFFRWLVVGFHAIIILLLSPWGLNWNVVVIPWNITLAAMVWLIFYDTDQTFLPKNYGLRFSLLLAALAPLFNFLGSWPDPLSWKLYSNTQAEATFYAPAKSFDGQAEAVVWGKNAFDQHTKLLLDDWAMNDLQTPMFATGRTFRQTARYLCGCNRQPDSAGLYILTVHPWNRRNEQWQKIPCRDLLKTHE